MGRGEGPGRSLNALFAHSLVVSRRTRTPQPWRGAKIHPESPRSIGRTGRFLAPPIAITSRSPTTRARGLSAPARRMRRQVDLSAPCQSPFRFGQGAIPCATAAIASAKVKFTRTRHMTVRPTPTPRRPAASIPSCGSRQQSCQSGLAILVAVLL